MEEGENNTGKIEMKMSLIEVATQGNKIFCGMDSMTRYDLSAVHRAVSYPYVYCKQSADGMLNV